jgi:hypothetical protein
VIMSMDYLTDLENHIDNGRTLYACPAPQGSEWYVSSDIEELKKKGQRSANARKMPVSIYKLVNKMDTSTGDSYLFVRKILEPGPKGEPHLNWSMADTREAAEMMRDVSEGPTPYFGTVIEVTYEPA